MCHCWTLFFLHKGEKWGHILRRKKKKGDKIIIWFSEEILQEILGFLLQCSWVCHYWCPIKKSFPAYFLWEGAVHVAPLILMCTCIPPVWMESFVSGTDQLWLKGWARAPAACSGYWYMNVQHSGNLLQPNIHSSWISVPYLSHNEVESVTADSS